LKKGLIYVMNCTVTKKYIAFNNNNNYCITALGKLKPDIGGECENGQYPLIEEISTVNNMKRRFPLIAERLFSA